MLMKGLSLGVKHGHPKDTFKPVITSVAFLRLHGLCLSTREKSGSWDGGGPGQRGRRYRRVMSHVPDINEEKEGLQLCLYTGGWRSEL